MSYRPDLKDVLASHVNDEAIIFRGSTTGELMTLAGLLTIIIVPVFLTVGFFIDRTMIMLTLSLPFLFLMLFVMTTIMQKIKRGRPDGYCQHMIMKYKQYLGFEKPPFIEADGVMSTLRNTQCLIVDRNK